MDNTMRLLCIGAALFLLGCPPGPCLPDAPCPHRIRQHRAKRMADDARAWAVDHACIHTHNRIYCPVPRREWQTKCEFRWVVQLGPGVDYPVCMERRYDYEAFHRSRTR